MRQDSALDGAVSLTKVALRRPASVCPKRSDNSSVAKERSYAALSGCQVAEDMSQYTPLRGEQ